MDRDFTALRPNQLWVADFTHVPTTGGVVYVAFIVDVFSRYIAGWAASGTKRTRLVLDALDQAIWHRDRLGATIGPHLTHHSDAGSQNTSLSFAEHLTGEDIDASIGSVGDAYDNALMESTIGLYKTELIKQHPHWRNLSDIEFATAEWIDWYNNARIHSSIHDATPASYEAAWHEIQAATKPVTTLNPTP